MTITATPITVGGDMTTRSGLASYLSANYANLVSEANTGQLFTDTTAGVKYVIDNAFRQLGAEEDELGDYTVDQSLVNAAVALVEYFQIERMITDVAARVDVGDPKLNAKESQLVTNLEKLLKIKREAAMRYGGYLSRTISLKTSQINLGVNAFAATN